MSLSLQSLFRIAFFLCVALVAYGILSPSPPTPGGLFPHADKVGHLIAFFSLGITGRLAFPHFSAHVFWAILLLMAPLLEGVQGLLLEQRHASVDDVMANLAGAALAYTVMRMKDRRASDVL